MITTIITVGNSRGIRIPKPVLEESGLKEKVELRVKKGEIRILPEPSMKVSQSMMLSEKVLAVDWDRHEEYKALAILQ